MKSYTATYSPHTSNGEPGYSYTVTAGGRFVFGGWSRGRKANAEAEVREGINAREALRECVGLS